MKETVCAKNTSTHARNMYCGRFCCRFAFINKIPERENIIGGNQNEHNESHWQKRKNFGKDDDAYGAVVGNFNCGDAF
jgi:hypothetical protein